MPTQHGEDYDCDAAAEDDEGEAGGWLGDGVGKRRDIEGGGRSGGGVGGESGGDKGSGSEGRGGGGEGVEGEGGVDGEKGHGVESGGFSYWLAEWRFRQRSGGGGTGSRGGGDVLAPM